MSLNQETLIKIQNELQGLSPEEQQLRLNEILSTFPEEEVSGLQRQQCIFCAIARGDVASRILYEDDIVMAIFDISPANPGHVLLYPKEHVGQLNKLTDNELSHLFLVANKITEKFQEKLNAPGFNIILNQGRIAGQKASHLLLHLIPRFKDDNLGFEWIPKEVSDSETDNIMRLLKPIIIKKEEVIQKPVEIEDESELDDEFSSYFEPRIP